MDNIVFEILKIVFIAASFVLSIIAIVISRKAGSASLELSMQGHISQTKQKVADVSMAILPLTCKKEGHSLASEDKKLLEGYEKVLNTAIETNINAYEEACAKYLDGKVDKVRFKKTYAAEIRQLVQTEQYSRYFDRLGTKYNAIKKVYDEWENLEK